MEFRTDLQGIRAIAVLAVVAYHTKFPFLHGGFLGVDVFFVLSGYLMAINVSQRQAEGRFAYGRFLIRRFLRIYPALLAMLIVSATVAWRVAFPQELQQFVGGMWSSALLASNVLFWRTSGYFDDLSLANPLIHTWSLSLEAQYYLVFPLIFVFFRRHWRFPALTVLTLASLCLALWATPAHASASFYLLPTRGWEFFAGAMVAHAPRSGKFRYRWALTAIGLATIMFSFLIVTETDVHPGAITVLPVLGTCLMIGFGCDRGPVNWVLERSLLQFLGAISYSLYLWHQPILALGKMGMVTAPGIWQTSAMLLLAVLVSWISYFVIEQPFRGRTGPFNPSRRTKQIVLSIGAVAALGFSLAVTVNHGYPNRFDQSVLRLLAQAGKPPELDCHYPPREMPAQMDPACWTNATNEQQRVLIFGDSHAHSIAREVSFELQAKNVSTYRASLSGCPAIPSLKRVGNYPGDDCVRFVEQVLRWARQNRIDTLVYVSRLPLYVYGTRFDNGMGGIETGKPVRTIVRHSVPVSSGSSVGPGELLRAFAQDVEALAQDFSVVLVVPVPEAGWNVPLHLAKIRRISGHLPERLSTPKLRYRHRTQSIQQTYQSLANSNPRISVAHIDRLLCSDSGNVCYDYADGNILYRDDNHLSHAGALLVTPEIVQRVLTMR